MSQTRNVPDRPSRGRPCPRCGRPMERVDHEIGGAVQARPCGCPVRYRIEPAGVTVTDLREDEAA